jgi:hypothetical protein
MATEARQEPALVLLVLFASYLSGTLVRTLPVRTVERLLPPFHVTFPHWRVLRSFVAGLRTNAAWAGLAASELPDLPADIPYRETMLLFNHWKSALSVRTPDSFRYYQTFESRSRMFAGMFWAGLLGAVGSIYTLARLGVTVFLHTPFAWQALAVSLLIALLFGGQFRRVREQEARVLLSLYLWSKREVNAAG